MRSLAGVLGVRYAIVTELNAAARMVRSLAFWGGDGFLDNIEYALDGTPCERVIDGKFSLYPERLQQTFPDDSPLVELGAESYLGVPLFDQQDRVMGHLFVMDTKPMHAAPRSLGVFRVFGALASGEVARMRLERSLGESEERLRDLFDEAPIAY
ncbi:MAG: Fis family transcriptional regulator, partial [Chloroflexi bacterium]|nr:Fis family transcriptional regulator [Chloroflexota bacterium]